MKYIQKAKKKGFTLTEMLVVVMVISVLAAIAYPIYTKAATKSRAIEAINLLEMVRNKQLQKYAADHAYYSSFDNMGQLTTNKRQETISGQVLKIKDYTLSLNNVHSCMTATYEKGSTTFSFSSSYEYTGLGCTGNVCSSFGDIVGTAKDVCNCGSKSCSNGYTLNEDTCNCDCYLGCDQGGTCFAPYGGGLTRACATGCGTQSSASTCNGAVWSGSCWSPTQTQVTSQTCASGCGTQTRTCTSSCSGGSCGSWNTSACYAKTQTLETSRSCGNSGTQTRTCTATCSGGSCGAWGACTGEKTACPSTCPTGQKRNTSVANVEDGSCCIAKTACASTCPSGQQRNTSVSYSEDGSCCIGKTACPSTCPTGKKRDTSVSYSEDGTCCVAKTSCPSTCPSGQQRDTNVSYTEDGTCCTSKTPCPSTCPTGKKRDTSVSYSEDGTCCIAKTACASTCQSGYHRDTAVSYSEDGTCCVKDDCDANEKALCENTLGSWNSTGCTCSCSSGKSWDSSSGCQCSNASDSSICSSSGGTWSSSSCQCACPSSKTFTSSNGCACSNSSDQSACISGGGSWNSSSCSCSCGTGKTWSGSACVCSDTSAQTKCTNSKGTWNANSCSCSCSAANYSLVNGTCTAKFKAQTVSIGVMVNCHYCPEYGRGICGNSGANPEDCYYSDSFDTSAGCSPATSTREASQYVISYEFYVGGYLELRAGSDTRNASYEAAYLWWTGGTRIGGKMYRYSGGSMPSCPSDPQTFCDQRCKATSSSCNDKCLVNMSTSGCSNPRYKYCWNHCSPTRYDSSNASGSGTVVMCK